jgi:Ran GTPase-activating protein (RanGAP) involved in mRNA processing and transport
VADGLKANKQNSISSIAIAGNSISDKGMSAWGQAIGSMTHGLQSLDISENGASKTGMAGFFNGMRKNVFMAASLNSLDVNGNRLENDGSAALAAFLANPNQLHSLNLANCQANLGSILGAITRGSPELHYVDLSHNKIGRKEIGQLKLFLQGSSALKGLNLSATALTVDLLKEVCAAVFNNPYLQEFSLNISNNKLGPAGAKLLAGFSATMTNVATLVVSDNDFGDEGVYFMSDGLQKNKSLKSLSIGGNFTGNGGPKRDKTVETLIDLVSSECPLTSFSLKGNPRNSLKQDVVHFLYALGTNDSLVHLDLTNVGMGDRGAMALGKALQTNRTLKSVAIDGNGIRLPGLQR